MHAPALIGMVFGLFFQGWSVGVISAEVEAINAAGEVLIVEVYGVLAREPECRASYAFNIPREPYTFQMVGNDLAIISDGGIINRLGSCRAATPASLALFSDGFESGSTSAWSGKWP